MEHRRTAIYVIIAVSLFAGLITGRTFFFNVTYAFTGLLIFAFFWAWSAANWLRMSRQTRARRAQVGRYLEERFSIRNTSLIPKLWLEIYDQSTLPGHRASHVLSNLNMRAIASWSVRTLCIRRGEFALGPLRLVAGDPFGLFDIERKIAATSRLVVFPATVDIPGFTLPTGILPGGDALRRRTHYVTVNASGVRDYQPGDSINRIHWRSTARKDRLIVKEFELDPLADIWIMMDLDQTVHHGTDSLTEADAERMPWEIGSKTAIAPSTEEYCVTIAASLSQYFLAQDRSLGFVANGQREEMIQIDRGTRQLNKILETLAVVKAGNILPFDQLISLEGANLSRGTTLILITPSTREGWITGATRLLRRGLRIIVILVDAESFGGRPGVRQAAAQLETFQIPVYVVRKDDDLRAVLGRAR